MAIVREGYGKGYDVSAVAAGDSPESITVPAGANCLVVGWILQNDSSQDISAVQYDGSNMTQLGEITIGGTFDNRVELWGIMNPSTGANNLTFTYGDTGRAAALVWAAYSGVDSFGNAETKGRTGGTFDTTQTLTMSANSLAVVLGVNNDPLSSGIDMAASSGASTPMYVDDETSFSDMFIFHEHPATTAGDYTVGFTHTGGSADDRCMVAAELIEASGGGGVDVDGSLDTLAITENAAAVQINRDVSGTLDALVLTEYGASVQINYGIDGSLDALAITEYGADVQINRDITGNLDTLTISEYQATIQAFQDTNVSGSLDTLSITEYQASIDIVGETAVTGTLDTLAITEYGADVQINRDVSGSLDTLAITEYQANIGLGLQVLGSLDELTITEYQATIVADINVSGALDALTLTEYQGTVTAGQDVEVLGSLDSLAITEFQASITAAQYITGSLDALNVTEYGATITAAIAVSASLDALTLTEYRATIAGDAIVQPTVTDVITLAGSSRTVTPKGTARTINLNRWN